MTKSMEVVLKTDSRGRVRTPADRREQLLDEFERSGLSGVKFAGLTGIKYQTFAVWVQRRRRQRGSSARAGKSAEQVRWLEAVLADAQTAPAGKDGALKVHLPGGAWIEVSQVQQMPLAVALVRALEKPAIPC